MVQVPRPWPNESARYKSSKKPEKAKTRRKTSSVSRKNRPETRAPAPSSATYWRTRLEFRRASTRLLSLTMQNHLGTAREKMVASGGSPSKTRSLSCASAPNRAKRMASSQPLQQLTQKMQQQVAQRIQTKRRAPLNWYRRTIWSRQRRTIINPAGSICSAWTSLSHSWKKAHIWKSQKSCKWISRSTTTTTKLAC